MQVVHSTINPLQQLLPYIVISGSYKENKENDTICDVLASHFSQLPIGLMSGDNKPGRQISISLFSILHIEDRYDPDKIVFFFRRKEKEPERQVKDIGASKFYGNNSFKMRQFMISKAQIMIIIGGKTGTKEEELLATKAGIPVIPIARTGGSAKEIWDLYVRNGYKQFLEGPKLEVKTFDELNNTDIYLAANAAVTLVKNVLNM